MSHLELVNQIKHFSVKEKLILVEEILRTIREEDVLEKNTPDLRETSSEPAILSLAGIIDDEEAKVFYSAIKESRKIDKNEW